MNIIELYNFAAIVDLLAAISLFQIKVQLSDEVFASRHLWSVSAGHETEQQQRQQEEEELLSGTRARGELQRRRRRRHEYSDNQQQQW